MLFILSVFQADLLYSYIQASDFLLKAYLYDYVLSLACHVQFLHFGPIFETLFIDMWVLIGSIFLESRNSSSSSSMHNTYPCFILLKTCKKDEYSSMWCRNSKKKLSFFILPRHLRHTLGISNLEDLDLNNFHRFIWKLGHHSCFSL